MRRQRVRRCRRCDGPVKIDAEKGLGTGLGDCVMMCWLPSDVTFYCIDKVKREIFSLFGRTVTDDPKGAVSMQGAFRFDLGRCKRQRLTNWTQALRISGECKRPTADIPTDITADIEGEPILLFPLSKKPCRTWPATYWIDLAWRLRHRGELPMIFLPTQSNDFLAAPFYCHGFSITYLAAMMRLGKCVIGCDSMPAHLAATIGAKTYVLAGPSGDGIYRHAKVTMIRAPIDCSPCHFRKGWKKGCSAGCEGLFKLSVESVLDTVV